MYNDYNDYYVELEEESDYTPECNGCNDRDETLQAAADSLKELFGILYGKTNFNLIKLEEYLEELADHLDVKLPENDLVIQRTQGPNLYKQTKCG